MGMPDVLNWTVCEGTAGVGVASTVVKLSEDALALRVGGGAVTSSVTLVVPGAATPTAVKTTAAVYLPASSPVGFSRRFTVAGRRPVSGVAVIHDGPAGTIAAV